jgi:hypothetical protein
VSVEVIFSQDSLYTNTEMKAINWSLFCLIQLLSLSVAFAPVSQFSVVRRTALHDKKLERDIEERANRKAQGGVAETAAGAVLGGLLGGPFGALFGASVGSRIGGKNALDRARQEETERLGVSQDMLDAAEDIGIALERSMDGLQASLDSLGTQQRIARRLDGDATDLYEKAKAAIAASNEEAAKKYLYERTKIQDKLKQVLKQCAEEKRRYAQMESNVSALEQRATEVNSLLRRAVGAKTMQDANGLGLGLSTEDPLLQKFRDAGIN